METITKDKVKRFADMLSGASRVAVLSHTRPDGDAVGSTCALRSFVEDAFGVQTAGFFANAWSDTVDFVFGDSLAKSTYVMTEDEKALREAAVSCDMVVCLDCSSFVRTESLSGIFGAMTVPKVLIDHHLNPSEEEFDLVFSQTDVSSTCELLYYILKEINAHAARGESFPRICLDALMTGMTTDSNNFANSVFPTTLQMASELIALGADRDGVLQHIYESYRENRLRLIGRLLSSEMKICRGGIAYTVLTSAMAREFDVREGDLEGYVNMPLAVADVRMSLFLKEDDGFFRVSVRSKRGTSANRMAVGFFHGGGHLQASGGRLFFPSDIEDASKVYEYLDNAIEQFCAQEDR